MITRPALVRFAVLLMLAVPSVWAQTPYRETNVEGGARIVGTVRCVNGTPKDLTRMERTKDEAVCGKAKASGHLLLGRNGSVQNAVVSLEGISRGKKMSGSMKPVLDQKGCEYEPHILIAPLGSQLEIVNDDPILHNVHAYAGKTLHTMFNIAQPIKGQRTSIKQMKMTEPGVVTATCDAGHPWMSAYIVVARHPYYALTDKKGNFVLEDVPAGTYKLRMWHEGVRVTRVEYEHDTPKKYYFEEPYIVTREVTVKNGETRRVDFELKLRKKN